MKSLLLGAVASFLLLGNASVAVAQAQAQAPAPQTAPCAPRVTPSEQELDDRTMRRFGSVGLTPQQQSQIQSIIARYSQAHPAGTPLDMPATREMRQDVFAVLSQAQQDTFRQNMEQRREGMPEHRPCAPR